MDQVFQGLSDAEIMARCKSAWKSRKRMGSQEGPDGVKRVRYRGMDEGHAVEFWYNSVTKTVETAFPVERNRS